MSLRETAKTAIISGDEMYRYSLTRTWEPGLKCVLWIMLNPSTADAGTDDPTIRRCIRFSQDWGYGSIEVVNLFALRSSTPKALWNHRDPIGPDNPAHIGAAIIRADLIIAAWGASASTSLGRRVAWDTCHALGGRTVYCLGTTRERAPRHPLYVRADTKLDVYQ